jgi:hypothetical protein
MMDGPEHSRGAAGRSRWVAWLGVAAAAAVGVSLAVALWVAPTVSDATNEIAVEPHPLFDAVGDALGALGQSEAEFMAARDELLTALESRRHEIAPATMSTVQANLGVIDGAIVELARALERDPDNPRLARLLAAACRKELELLRQATSLPSGSAEVDVQG